MSIQDAMTAVDIAKLLPLTEGEQFELGALMPNLDAGEERVVWEVLEKIQNGEAARLTLHAYYHGVFLFAATASILGEKAAWRFS